MQETTRAELRRIGKAIRETRHTAGFSQEKLAEIADIDRTYVGRIEAGAQNISWESISRLARALKLKPSELLARAKL